MNSLHPGVIRTNLSRQLNPLMRGFFALGAPLFLKTLGQGTATQVYVATHPDVTGVSGEYFADCNVAKTSAHGRDDRLAEALWNKTEEIVAGIR